MDFQESYVNSTIAHTDENLPTVDDDTPLFDMLEQPTPAPVADPAAQAPPPQAPPAPEAAPPPPAPAPEAAPAPQPQAPEAVPAQPPQAPEVAPAPQPQAQQDYPLTATPTPLIQPVPETPMTSPKPPRIASHRLAPGNIIPQMGSEQAYEFAVTNNMNDWSLERVMHDGLNFWRYNDMVEFEKHKNVYALGKAARKYNAHIRTLKQMQRDDPTIEVPDQIDTESPIFIQAFKEASKQVEDKTMDPNLVEYLDKDNVAPYLADVFLSPFGADPLKTHKLGKAERFVGGTGAGVAATGLVSLIPALRVTPLGYATGGIVGGLEETYTVPWFDMLRDTYPDHAGKITVAEVLGSIVAGGGAEHVMEAGFRKFATWAPNSRLWNDLHPVRLYNTYKGSIKLDHLIRGDTALYPGIVDDSLKAVGNIGTLSADSVLEISHMQALADSELIFKYGDLKDIRLNARHNDIGIPLRPEEIQEIVQTKRQATDQLREFFYGDTFETGGQSRYDTDVIKRTRQLEGELTGVLANIQKQGLALNLANASEDITPAILNKADPDGYFLNNPDILMEFLTQSDEITPARIAEVADELAGVQVGEVYDKFIDELANEQIAAQNLPKAQHDMVVKEAEKQVDLGKKIIANRQAVAQNEPEPFPSLVEDAHPELVNLLDNLTGGDTLVGDDIEPFMGLGQLLIGKRNQQLYDQFKVLGFTKEGDMAFRAEDIAPGTPGIDISLNPTLQKLAYLQGLSISGPKGGAQQVKVPWFINPNSTVTLEGLHYSIKSGLNNATNFVYRGQPTDTFSLGDLLDVFPDVPTGVTQPIEVTAYDPTVAAVNRIRTAGPDDFGKMNIQRIEVDDLRPSGYEAPSDTELFNYLAQAEDVPDNVRAAADRIASKAGLEEGALPGMARGGQEAVGTPVSDRYESLYNSIVNKLDETVDRGNLEQQIMEYARSGEIPDEHVEFLDDILPKVRDPEQELTTEELDILQDTLGLELSGPEDVLNFLKSSGVDTPESQAMIQELETYVTSQTIRSETGPAAIAEGAASQAQVAADQADRDLIREWHRREYATRSAKQQEFLAEEQGLALTSARENLYQAIQNMPIDEAQQKNLTGLLDSLFTEGQAKYAPKKSGESKRAYEGRVQAAQYDILQHVYTRLDEIGLGQNKVAQTIVPFLDSLGVDPVVGRALLQGNFEQAEPLIGEAIRALPEDQQAAALETFTSFKNAISSDITRGKAPAEPIGMMQETDIRRLEPDEIRISVDEYRAMLANPSEENEGFMNAVTIGLNNPEALYSLPPDVIQMVEHIKAYDEEVLNKLRRYTGKPNASREELLKDKKVQSLLTVDGEIQRFKGEAQGTHYEDTARQLELGLKDQINNTTHLKDELQVHDTVKMERFFNLQLASQLGNAINLEDGLDPGDLPYLQQFFTRKLEDLGIDDPEILEAAQGITLEIGPDGENVMNIPPQVKRALGQKQYSALTEHLAEQANRNMGFPEGDLDQTKMMLTDLVTSRQLMTPELQAEIDNLEEAIITGPDGVQAYELSPTLQNIYFDSEVEKFGRPEDIVSTEKPGEQLIEEPLEDTGDFSFNLGVQNMAVKVLKLAGVDDATPNLVLANTPLAEDLLQMKLRSPTDILDTVNKQITETIVDRLPQPVHRASIARKLGIGKVHSSIKTRQLHRLLEQRTGLVDNMTNLVTRVTKELEQIDTQLKSLDPGSDTAKRLHMEKAASAVLLRRGALMIRAMDETIAKGRASSDTFRALRALELDLTSAPHFIKSLQKVTNDVFYAPQYMRDWSYSQPNWENMEVDELEKAFNMDMNNVKQLNHIGVGGSDKQINYWLRSYSDKALDEFLDAETMRQTMPELSIGM